MNAALGGSTERVLLVGDGDFSFSLALTKYLPPSCIVGTNLEDEESIQKHKHVQENMKKLLGNGAHLILGVDARELHTHPQIGQLRFQRIIFNFPHIGGKSNNKKNRALLNDFFKSAAEVLIPEGGEVMVTLCRGQGGTPADQPRLWADTWQIVSMAANSGFILTQVVPFETEFYPGYSCTGFRSQDKGFRTEGGLTHTFERRDPVPVPLDVNPLPIILDKKEVLCPTYLHSKISSYRKILQNPLHPLKQTQDALISEMERLQIMKIINEDQLPCLLQQSDLSVSSPELLACQLRLRESLAEEEEGEEERISVSNQGEYTTFSSNDPTPPANVLEPPDNRTFLKEFYFRTSLIENLPILLNSEDFENRQWVMINGLTFRQGVISPCFLPVSVELLGVTKCNFEENNLSLTNIYGILSGTLKTCFSVSPEFVSITENQPPIRIKTISVEFIKKIICKHTTAETCIGRIFKVSNEDDDKKCQFWGFLLSIDSLTQIRFQLDHKSILWHENIRKFLNPDLEIRSASITKREPVSIFPLKFIHDMSFWENAELVFDENQLSRIVRDVAGDCVSSATLIDTYHEPETKRAGRCYRFTFQSWDFCLSYKTSWTIQSLIRLVTAQKMGVTLR